MNANGRTVVIEIRIEIIIRNDEYPLRGVCLVKGLDLGGRLQAKGGLATPFLSEDQGRGWVGRAAEELVPGGVVDGRQTSALENRVRLGILLTERIASDTMVLQELFRLHPWLCLSS